jgi:uncharacterized DUF497 family protein
MPIYIKSMDKTYQLKGITFVWDSNKAQINLNNHGITFEQAAEAFFDPFLRVVDASPEEEVRDAVIGMDMHWNLLFIVHIFVEEEQVLTPVQTRAYLPLFRKAV